MEKRRKGDQVQWITPGAFCGIVEADDAVQRISATQETGSQINQDQVQEKIHQLENQLAAMQASLAEWEKKFQKAEAEHKKEREHLYQVVLMLKREWELQRSGEQQ